MARTKTTKAKRGRSKAVMANKAPRQRRHRVTMAKETPLLARYRTVNGRRMALPPKGHVRKPRRYRPGTVALREIRKYQKSTGLLIHKRPFQRLVREICSKLGPDVNRWTNNAMLALQEAAEDLLVNMFSEAQLCAVHGNRQTLKLRDLQLLQRLKPDTYCIQSL